MSDNADSTSSGWLILKRKRGEGFVVGPPDAPIAEIVIRDAFGGTVVVAIRCPERVEVWRDELRNDVATRGRIRRNRS
jgi:sRNA-binding carbon storage regulator CsrA